MPKKYSYEDCYFDQKRSITHSHQMLNDGKELKKAFDKKSKNYLIPLSTGRFLSKTYILSNREKEKERGIYN